MRISLKVVEVLVVVAGLLEFDLSTLVLAESLRLVDLGSVWQLSVLLERSRLVGRVLLDNVGLVVLEVTERDEDNVTLVDPDLLAELATNVSKTLLAVKALRFETAISKHLEYLSVL